PLLMWLSAPEFSTMIRPYRAPNGSGRCLDCRDLQGDLRRIRVISSGRTISYLPAGKVIEWRAPVQRRFANTLTNSACTFAIGPWRRRDAMPEIRPAVTAKGLRS